LSDADYTAEVQRRNDLIESLRSRAENAEAERDEARADQQQALDLCAAAVDDYNDALATCEKLAKALDQCQRALASMIDPSCIAQTTVIYAFATATTAEATARHVLSEYRKEASDADQG
jgi:chromosome segregation ATPase